MSEPVLIQSTDRLEVRTPMRGALRILLMLVGLFPLIAPSELLVRPDWQNYVHPFFLLAALISVGALAVSLCLFFTAAAGISSQLVLDRTAKTITYFSESPIFRWSRAYPLSAIASVEVGEHSWSDGAPTYNVSVRITDGALIQTGSSWSREGMDALRAHIERFLAGESAGRSG